MDENDALVVYDKFIQTNTAKGTSIIGLMKCVTVLIKEQSLDETKWIFSLEQMFLNTSRKLPVTYFSMMTADPGQAVLAKLTDFSLEYRLPILLRIPTETMKTSIKDTKYIL